MDNADSNDDKSTTDEQSFQQTPWEEDKQPGTENSDGSKAHLDAKGSSQHPGRGQLMSVDSSKDPNNNLSPNVSANFSAPASISHPPRDFSSERENEPWIGDRILLRAPKKMHVVKHNMDRTNKLWRRPKCGRNLFGWDQDVAVSADGNEKPYQEEVGVSVTSDKSLQSSQLSGHESFSLTDVEMSARHLVYHATPCVNFCSEHSSSNYNVDNFHSDEAVSNSDNQTVCGNASQDCDNVNDRSEEASTDLTSDEEYSRRHAAGALFRSPATNDGNNNPRGLAEGNSDAEYDRPRLLPEHYVAPRRQRRLPSSIRARMASIRRRRLSFNSSDDESNNQQVLTEDADLQLSDEVNSPHALSSSLESRLSNQNTRRRLFDNDNSSLRKSLYTLIHLQNNSGLSNLGDEATIQSILNTVFGFISYDNICSRQWRSDSDAIEDLGSSGKDCNTVNGSSDNDSSDLSSDKEYWRSAAESVYFLSNPLLPALPSDICSLRLCLCANEDNDNLGYCATESSDVDNKNPILYNSDDGGCSNSNGSAQNEFPCLTSSEDDSRSQTADTPPLSPVTNDNRNNLMDSADSDAEYNRRPHRPEQCAAPSRQCTVPVSRSITRAPMCRRRLCFDNCDEETNNQGAISGDTSVDSDAEYNRRPHRPEQCAAPRRQRTVPVSRSITRAPMCRRRLCFDNCDEKTNNQGAISGDTSVDSDAEYNRRPHRPEQCAAPRRQRRVPVSRRTRRASMCSRRLCFDDCDGIINNQEALSGDTIVVSEPDCNSPTIHRLFTDNNKYRYSIAPSYDQSGQSGQMDLPICDNWSSSQTSLNSNAPSETDPGHSCSQPSLSTESGTRLSNNGSHNSSSMATDSTRVSNNYSHNSCNLATDSTRVSNNLSHNSSSLTTDTEEPKQTESPSHPPSPSHSDASFH